LSGDPASAEFSHRTTTAMRLERAQDAAVLMRQALERSPDRIAFRHALHRSSFLIGDADGMATQVEWATRTPNAEALFVDASDGDAYYGRIQTARRWLQRAVKAATRGDFKGNAAVWSATDALRWALYGNAVEARQQARAALDFEDSWETRALAATALARIGDATQAGELIAKLNAERPFGTLVQRYWLPVIRAELEIRAGHAKKAIGTLEAATPYELADTRMPLLPAFVRGEAYLDARDGRAASDEFRKLVQHRGLVGNSPLGALAHLSLARALALAHDTWNARQEYETFLELWKDADAGIPILTQAQTEFRASKSE